MNSAQMLRLLAVTGLAFVTSTGMVWFGWDLAYKLYGVGLEYMKRRKLRPEDKALHEGETEEM